MLNPKALGQEKLLQSADRIAVAAAAATALAFSHHADNVPFGADAMALRVHDCQRTTTGSIVPQNDPQ